MLLAHIGQEGITALRPAASTLVLPLTKRADREGEVRPPHGS